MSDKKLSFFSRNLVTIIMIPALIGIHLGWSVLQKNRVLVSESEEIDLPPVTFLKYTWKRLTTDERNEKDGKAATSAE